MSRLSLENKVIGKIKNADENLLQELLDWLTFQMDSNVYEVNDLEKSVLEEAQAQIESGNTHSNEEVENKINEWLGK